MTNDLTLTSAGVIATLCLFSSFANAESPRTPPTEKIAAEPTRRIRIKARAAIGVATSSLHTNETLVLSGSNQQLEAGYSAQYDGSGLALDFGVGFTVKHLSFGMSIQTSSSPVTGLGATPPALRFEKRPTGAIQRTLVLFELEYQSYETHIFFGGHFGAGGANDSSCCTVESLESTEVEFQRTNDNSFFVAGLQFGIAPPLTDHLSLRVALTGHIMPGYVYQAPSSLPTIGSLTVGLVYD